MLKYLNINKKRIFQPIACTVFSGYLYDLWCEDANHTLSGSAYFKWAKDKMGLSLLGYSHSSGDCEYAIFESEEERLSFCLTYGDQLHFDAKRWPKGIKLQYSRVIDK